MKKESTTLSDGEMLKKILSIVEHLIKSPPSSMAEKIYDNKALMTLLNIKDKYLKRLRDNGYLGYSRCGDKYWYSQSDVDSFLHRFHYKAFANTDELPSM